MQLQVGHLQAEKVTLAYLTADGDVRQTRLIGARLLIIALCVESHLVVQKDDELLLQPLSYVLLALTGWLACAHLELKRNDLCFDSVVVAPDLEVFLLQTLELLPVG